MTILLPVLDNANQSDCNLFKTTQLFLNSLVLIQLVNGTNLIFGDIQLSKHKIVKQLFIFMCFSHFQMQNVGVLLNKKNSIHFFLHMSVFGKATQQFNKC